MTALALLLALALALALALVVALMLTLPRRVAQLIAHELAARASDPRAPATRAPGEASLPAPAPKEEAPGSPAPHDAAPLPAFLDVGELPTPRGPRPPLETLPPDTAPPFSRAVVTTHRAPLARPPASRDRPTPRAVTPPGSARALPPEPGILAARLGPRLDTTSTRHRAGEQTVTGHDGGAPHTPGPAGHTHLPETSKPPAQPVTGHTRPARQALARTMPSMETVGPHAQRAPSPRQSPIPAASPAVAGTKSKGDPPV